MSNDAPLAWSDCEQRLTAVLAYITSERMMHVCVCVVMFCLRPCVAHIKCTKWSFEATLIVKRKFSPRFYPCSVIVVRKIYILRLVAEKLEVQLDLMLIPCCLILACSKNPMVYNSKLPILSNMFPFCFFQVCFVFMLTPDLMLTSCWPLVDLSLTSPVVFPSCFSCLCFTFVSFDCMHWLKTYAYLLNIQ